ncbi:nuclear transport factor 2 family protein [Chelativorans sp. YIM 93263]|uniref:nuclear transport factor 2 family protein n=1 Tax=Chelativorans sp. YIM 93263 TaxID=2906648 RepID=UPI0023780B41|nr:nuclear transport factor 2 family protein [Chelativorans sp. YIM 93263]
MTNEKENAVRQLFEAYRVKDRAMIEPLLADDFTFTSPYDDAIDKQTYFERCWPNSERIEQHFLEEVVGSGDRVFVLYLCRTREGKEFCNVETFDFEGSRIRAVNVYFGAAYADGVFQPS